tara:strand:+ start:725 stop:1513 length:789 start_codon:yes stop_codon:yes gene_type:complete
MSNPVMAALAVLALATATVFVGLLWLTRGQRRPTAQPRWLAWAGGIGLIAVWGFLVPVNVWSHLTGDQDAWIFGAETFDGGIVENLTVLFYGLAIVVCGWMFARASRLYGAASAGLWRVLVVVMIVCFAAMIGEEMSWGQHLFGFQTPADLAAVNLQGESNLHNLVSPRLYDLIYQGLGFALILLPPAAWFALRGPSLPSPVLFLQDLYTNPWVYSLLASAGVLLQHEVFEELAEMVLAFAILFALATLAGRGGRGTMPTST